MFYSLLFIEKFTKKIYNLRKITHTHIFENKRRKMMKQYGFGVDLGGTTCKIGLFKTSGELLDKWEIRTNTENNGASILDDIANAIESKILSAHIDKSDIQGIGIGVPGPVAADGTVYKCVNLGWGIFNVAEEMSNKTGLKVKAGNDANIAALGEMWQGAAKGYSDIVMATIGTGVGGGIIVNGQILSGAKGGAGEIGHICVNKDETEKCNCGKKGCLEQYASATGIVRMAKKKLHREEITAKEIFDEAKAGDASANELVNQLGNFLGTALASVANVTNPQIFIIGGGVSKAGKILIDTTEKHFKEQAFHVCSDAKFALAKLGNDAGIYGGVRLILE